MIKSFLIIVLIGGASRVYTDIESPSVFHWGVLPLRFALDKSPVVTVQHGTACAPRLGRCGYPEA
jgi:hypothetical protein